MELQNATETLTKALAGGSFESEEVESIHRAELEAKYFQKILDDPKAVLKALDIKVSDESQVQITSKNRADREARAVMRRRIIIVIIHWRNCDSDIIIIF